MKIDLKSLRAKVEAATPGPWGIENVDCIFGGADNPECKGDNPHVGQIEAKEDRYFIAAANPKAVLVLLDRVEKLESKMKLFALQGPREGASILEESIVEAYKREAYELLAELDAEDSK